MPVEVLGREEVERLIEEKAKTLPVIAELTRRIEALESSMAELKATVADFAAMPKSPEIGKVHEALVEDLGELVEVLEVHKGGDYITLRPRRYLGGRDFRAVSDVVRRHGGTWSSDRRLFIVQRGRTR